MRLFLCLCALLFSLPAWAQVEGQKTADAAGRTITYYLSHLPKPAPLLLMIQGSGCAPVMLKMGSADKIGRAHV